MTLLAAAGPEQAGAVSTGQLRRWRPAPGSRQLRRGLAAAASLTLAAGLTVAMGQADGFSAARLALASGQAWVASSRVGQIALIDGSTEQKVAAVTVATPGEQISVTQGGPDALVVNHSTGSLLRVRGSTYSQAPGPVRPLDNAGAGLSVFAGSGAEAFAVDAARGVAVEIDRASMTARRRPVSLAASLDSRATVIDTDGRLWAIDAASGDLVWFDAAGKHTRRNAASPGARTRLTLVRGEPAIVDAEARQVRLLDPSDGEQSRASCLDVAAGDQIQTGGSSSAPLVFTAAPERGVLLVSDLDSGQCSRVVSLTTPGARLGDPVETGGRVFVPDYASGQVFVVDLDTDSLVGSPAVLPAGLETFDLTPRDGFVFFNDPLSQRSGVVRLDGSVQRISKYNPQNPSQQLRRPTRDTPSGQNVTGADASGQGAGSGGTGKAGPGSGSTGTGSASKQPASHRPDTDPVQQRRPNTPQNPVLPQQPTEPGDPSQPVDQGSPSGPSSGAPSGPVRTSAVRISTRNTPPYVSGTVISFAVRAATPGRRVRSATWAFGDNTAPAPGVRAAHTWAAPGQYQVDVTAVLDDGSTASTAAPIVVVAPDAPPQQPPVAMFSLTPGAGTAPVTVTADASASHDSDGSIASYAVDWGDGAQTVGATAIVTHSYTAACSCQVRVTVTDDDGLTASTGGSITIQPAPPPPDAPPVADMVVTPTNPHLGDKVTVDGSGSKDAEGPVQYRISWGDGTSTTTGFNDTSTASHSYGATGSYTATLDVRDSAGQIRTLRTGVTVSPQPINDPPTAKLQLSPTSGQTDLVVDADASGSTNDTGVLRYVFDWGDGRSTTTSQDKVSHTYRDACACAVRLTVTDEQGLSDTATAAVAVTAAPKVVIENVHADPSSASGACPIKITFTADIRLVSGSGTFRYRWLRSDGATDTSNSSVTFGGPGTRTVTDTWTLGGAGQTYSEWEAVQVTDPVSVTSGQAGFTLTCDP